MICCVKITKVVRTRRLRSLWCTEKAERLSSESCSTSVRTHLLSVYVLAFYLKQKILVNSNGLAKNTTRQLVDKDKCVPDTDRYSTALRSIEFNSENDKKANSLEVARPLPHTQQVMLKTRKKNNTAASYVLCNPILNYYSTRIIS